MTSVPLEPLVIQWLRNPSDLTPLHLDTAEEWRAWLHTARQHGLILLLYRAVERTPQGRVPQDAYRELQAAAHAIVAKNLSIAEDLRMILARCHAQQLPCIVLRGAGLAEQLYGDGTLRPAGDIDLLIHKSDARAVTELLTGLGYQAIDRRRGFAEAFSYTTEFFREAPGSVMVEPHWSLAYPPFVDRLDMDAVWRRCVPGSVLGMDTLLLSREDCVLNLCLHLMHHGERTPLLWVYELDQILRREVAAFRWDVLVETARHAGVGRLVARALGRSHALLQTPIPDQAMGKLTAVDGARPLSHLAVERASITGKESFAVFFALKGLRRRWRYGWALLVPSPEFMRVHYGLSTRRQVMGWYVRRAWWLCVDSLKGIVQLISGSLRRRSSSAASASTKS